MGTRYADPDGDRRGERDWPFRRSPMARSMVRAVRGTRGMSAGLWPLPTMSTRCPRSMPMSSMLVSHASETRSPFKPSSTARADGVVEALGGEEEPA